MPTQDQLNDIIKQNTYTNAKLYHDHGLKGGGCNILVIDGEVGHREGNVNRVLEVAPKANVTLVGMQSSPGEEPVVIFNGKQMTINQIIEEKQIKLITKSLGGGSAEGTAESKWWNNLKDKYNLILNHAAGNKDIGGSIPHDAAMYVTQVTLDRHGHPVKTVTFADGVQIDFAMFPGYLNGSSFCSPALAAHQNLIIQRYGDYGKSMSHSEMMKYLIMICEDLYIEGKDVKVGHGIPILADFNTKYITMSTKSNKFYLDGAEHCMDTVPVNKEGTVFVPIRFMNSVLGAELKDSFNDDKTINVKIIKSNKTIEINQNSNIVFVNGTAYEIEHAPYIQNNRIMVPIRFVSEHLGCKVDWIQKEQKVMILG